MRKALRCCASPELATLTLLTMSTSCFACPPPLATLPEYPNVGESLLYQATGLAVVLIALCTIWFLLELIGVFFKRADARVKTAPVSPVATAAPAVASEPPPGTIPAEVVAVIAAAVHVTLGGRHRIHSVTPALSPVDWAREGRREIFASHKLR